MKTKVFSFRLTEEEIEKLEILAGRHNLKPREYARMVFRQYLGYTGKVTGEVAKEVNRKLADTEEEILMFQTLVADTTHRLESQVAGQGQLFIPKKKNVEGRKSKKQKQT